LATSAHRDDRLGRVNPKAPLPLAPHASKCSGDGAVRANDDSRGALLEFLDSNYMGWSAAMAPVIMGNADRPELGAELTSSFCRTDPDIARHFARVTFLSDNRADLAKLSTPALVLQCSEDAIAPSPVGRFVQAHLPESQLVMMQATGHCPNLSAPEETIAAMKSYLQAAHRTAWNEAALS
jgi:sigma-B regulation protein RsbQ